MQVEERYYKFEHNGQIYEGWTKNGCKDYFGHKKCLKSVQKYLILAKYINWITEKHKEFKKLNHIPEDFPYTDQQRKNFIEFLYKSVDK